MRLERWLLRSGLRGGVSTSADSSKFLQFVLQGIECAFFLPS